MTADHDLDFIGIDVTSQRPRVRAALEYIADHYCEAFEIRDLLAACGYAERGLQDALSRDVGMTATALIMRLRLEEGRRILLRTPSSFPVLEVAKAVGMPHAGRFSVRYRALFGETPTQTRSRSRSGMK